MSSQAAQTDYLRLVWENRTRILVGTLVFALLGLFQVWWSQDVYEAKATLLISPPSIKAPGPNAAGNQALAALIPPALPLETYLTLAKSPDLVQEVIRGTALQNAPIESALNRLRVIQQEGGRRGGGGIPYAQTIQFACRHDDPEVAGEVVQRWAETFKARMDGLTRQGIKETSELVDSMYSQARDDLDEAEQALQAFEKEWNVTLIEQERAAKELALTERLVELNSKRVESAGERARMEMLASALADEERTIVLRKAPPEEAYWEARMQGNGEAITSDDVLQTEELNPHYAQIQLNLMTTHMEVEYLEDSSTSLAEHVEMLREDIEALNRLQAEKQLERNRLQREVDSRETTYKLVLDKREQAKIARVSAASDVIIASNAVVPERPLADTAWQLKVAAFALFGFLLSIGYVVFAHALEQSSGKSE